MTKKIQLSRRDMLRFGAAGAAGIVGGKAFGALCSPNGTPIPIDHVSDTGCLAKIVGELEPFPVSPFILEPWKDPLPIPKALAPGYRTPDGKLYTGPASGAWQVRVRNGKNDPGQSVYGRDSGKQDAFGERDANDPLHLGLPKAGTHQAYPGAVPRTLQDDPVASAEWNQLADPLPYHIRLQVAEHSFTSSDVQQYDRFGAIVKPPPGSNAVASTSIKNAWKLPKCTIYGFNGTFPGPLINAEYRQPALVRFENDLDDNHCLDRQDFGAPDWGFLTHLHNGHTAPESDGQPHHMTMHDGGYQPGEWCDNLYLGYPAGGLPTEKQSFLWFHDHRMHHTGANVYKGMVGLMPHYDPVPVEVQFPRARYPELSRYSGPMDSGDERFGLRLPGQRTNNLDGSFDVKYDIPMAFYDVGLDDGVTGHFDDHTPLDVCGNTHAEWWGKHFFRHYPNHGFVGDIFTVNGKAFPVLNVERRKYRFRFLGASVSRCYELSFRTGTPVPAPGQQGQWRFGTAPKGKTPTTFNAGQLRTPMMQVASEGGILPFAIQRDTIEIWPAKRREVVVDFSKFSKGEVVYLVNTLQMPDGRKPVRPVDFGFDPTYCVPLVKIVVGDLPKTTDYSIMPAAGQVLRPMSPVSPTLPPRRTFTLSRGGPTSEAQWVINGLQFDPMAPLAVPKVNTFETWQVDNGGGGWTHPMHLHMEEHRIVKRSSLTPGHPEDVGREDVLALEGGESTTIYRGFRTFVGNYVAHCHNLAHEDHNMMFGWTIAP